MLVDWMFIDLADHGSEKRRLRTREEVGAVGVEDCTVVFDLKEEVLDHALGEFPVGLFSLFNKAEDDEITVPAVHFVEAASGHHVAIGKVEQTLHRNFGDAYISDVSNAAGQVPHLDVALLVR